MHCFLACAASFIDCARASAVSAGPCGSTTGLLCTGSTSLLLRLTSARASFSCSTCMRECVEVRRSHGVQHPTCYLHKHCSMGSLVHGCSAWDHLCRMTKCDECDSVRRHVEGMRGEGM
ncbi:hypothetical protein V8C86DRAFT_1360615 [Haematococcus lacustris]